MLVYVHRSLFHLYYIPKYQQRRGGENNKYDEEYRRNSITIINIYYSGWVILIEE